MIYVVHISLIVNQLNIPFDEIPGDGVVHSELDALYGISEMVKVILSRSMIHVAVAPSQLSEHETDVEVVSTSAMA